MQPACVAECQADSKVETRNERVERSRRTILEMLNASVNLDEAPEIQQMMAITPPTKPASPMRIYVNIR